MPIYQSKENSEVKRKFQHLQEQIYGKHTASVSHSDEEQKYSVSKSFITSGQSSHNTLAYLKTDLLKITVLSVFAFIVQVLLYFGLKHNLLRVPYSF